MKIDTSDIVKIKFISSVPINLLRKFLQKFSVILPFDPQTMTNGQLYDYLSQNGDVLPTDAMVALHEITNLARNAGYDFIYSRLVEYKTLNIPDEPDREIADMSHQELAMFCYLFHQHIFQEAQNTLDEETTKSHSKFNGIEPVKVVGNEIRLKEFKGAVEDYFQERGKSRYCKIDVHEENGKLHYDICHGKFKYSERIIENGNVRVQGFRPEKQDHLVYDVASGELLVTASTPKERGDLAQIYAREMLGRPDYFVHDNSQKNYKLKPLIEGGLKFKFEHKSVPVVANIVITEIQFAFGVRGEQRVTFRSANVLTQLTGFNNFNIHTDTIRHIKVKFSFKWEKKKLTREVQIIPPATANFDRSLVGERIMTVLRNNGFVYDRRPMQKAD